ncbi:importin subunit alpha-3-like [Halichondria panicea]|uniref:importin subunit alpha-3-like n=1 Tax=Halichondria panicea TaxID=6063 RepID=UPI00312B38C2
MSEGRLKTYKNKGRSLTDMRQRRSEVTVELRKNRKDEELLKRRNIEIPEDDDESSAHLPTLSSCSPETLRALVEKAQSADQPEQFDAVQLVRKILSKDKNPPIDMLINSGVVPVLVSCLESPVLQFEAAWALTNIASGNKEQTRTVVKHGAVPLLIKLLHSSQPHVCEQAVWALGNITGDGASCRDYVISEGIIEPLLSFVHANTAIPFLRNVAWTLSNLCRNKNPPPPFESVCKTLPALVHLVQHEDLAVKVDACWALSFLAEGKDRQIQVVVESQVIPHLVPLLAHSEGRVVMPALRTLGNIVTGNDEQTQAVLDGGILLHLLNLMGHTRPGIVREAVWTVSNIVAGNRYQVQMVIDANLVPSIIYLLGNGEFRTQKEAAWAVSNFTVGGTPEQVNYLVSQLAIPPMCNLLDCKDTTCVHVILDGLANMLKMAGPDVDFIATAIEEAGGLTKIEALQHHKNVDVYKLAYSIIDKYFSTDDIEDSSLLPSEGPQAFQFGPSDAPEGGYQF